MSTLDDYYKALTEGLQPDKDTLDMIREHEDDLGLTEEEKTQYDINEEDYD